MSRVLEAAGHNVIWAGNWETDPGDEEILSIAHREGRVLVTLDKDFGELAILFGQPHSGIIRLVNLSSKEQGEICTKVLARYETNLTNGALITAERDWVWVRE
jgi:predicted nuclease of predicted toxin-antitoxin system